MTVRTGWRELAYRTLLVSTVTLSVATVPLSGVLLAKTVVVYGEVTREADALRADAEAFRAELAPQLAAAKAERRESCERLAREKQGALTCTGEWIDG